MLSPGANATGSMADTHEGGDLAAVLSELQSLRTDITSIHDKMSDIAGFGGFTALKQDISANATRLNEAEDRIESAEESVQSMISELTAATKRIAYLETKTEDLENRGRRKNLRLVGLAEGTEGTQSMLSYIQHKMPLWLGLDPADTPFTIERAHRTLGRPKPETMKKRSQFNAVKKQFVEAGSFRGFQLQPCKMRIFHNGKIVTFSTPEEAENFRHK
uniref:Uncharacterized protein n=1 Tax=Knipowitschia caucasica TaxID=637954 RepID=A0AAV2MN19_KNICA